MYFVLKRIHLIILLVLFYSGSENINHLANLMFIIFFVVFSTYEKLYRSYSWVLSFFMSYLIFVQYFFHLRYHYYTEVDQSHMDSLTHDEKDNLREMLKLRLFNMGWFGFFKCKSFNMVDVNNPAITLHQMASKCTNPATFP